MDSPDHPPARATRARSSMYGESGYARLPRDAYLTEPRVTRALLARVPMTPPIWEPFAGRGDMVRVIEEAGCEVVASDIEPMPPFECLHIDFLSRAADQLARGSGARAIFSNPPFKNVEVFIQRALDLMQPVAGAVILLLRHEFDCAAKHRKLIEQHPAWNRKAVLTFRPRWSWWMPPEEQIRKKLAPRHNFSFYCWDWSLRRQQPTIYLP